MKAKEHCCAPALLARSHPRIRTYVRKSTAAHRPPKARSTPRTMARGSSTITPRNPIKSPEMMRKINHRFTGAVCLPRQRSSRRRNATLRSLVDRSELAPLVQLIAIADTGKAARLRLPLALRDLVPD